MVKLYWLMINSVFSVELSMGSKPSYTVAAFANPKYSRQEPGMLRPVLILRLSVLSNPERLNLCAVLCEIRALYSARLKGHIIN